LHPLSLSYHSRELLFWAGKIGIQVADTRPPVAVRRSKRPVPAIARTFRSSSALQEAVTLTAARHSLYVQSTFLTRCAMPEISHAIDAIPPPDDRFTIIDRQIPYIYGGMRDVIDRPINVEDIDEEDN
jgi:hypothetical protein